MIHMQIGTFFLWLAIAWFAGVGSIILGAKIK